MITIEVTQADIDCGKEGNVGECPIARAARRLPGFEDARVGHVTLSSDKNGVYYRLPAAAVHFVQTFDAGLTTEPFTFELTQPLGGS